MPQLLVRPSHDASSFSIGCSASCSCDLALCSALISIFSLVMADKDQSKELFYAYQPPNSFESCFLSTGNLENR